MQHFKIDINCDMGEGMGNEAYIMPFISSANIACGGHTGNADSIKRTMNVYAKDNITIIKPNVSDLINNNIIFEYCVI